MPDKQKGFSYIYLILLAAVIIAVAGGAYYFGTKNASQITPPEEATIPSSTPAPTPSPITSPSPSLSASPSATLSPALLENIKASVASKNTAALEGYMTDMVIVTIEATECCGNLTRVNAIKEMDYLNSSVLPWNFDDNNPIALALKQKNPAAFPDGIIIGTSSDRKLVTFTLNPDKTKIIKVYMAIDYKLHGI